ncbi:hypothetical protein [Rhizobium sp. TH135]|uniref:hypothetical protein n=1 Tax=Rhizobium sp. TH135 TaxID=2067451 RepID=UPI0015590A8C|nr:hypothetical protein [Rhizobium sp. TH135]
MKILFLLACACVIAATIGAVAIGLSLFTQPEAYAAMPVSVGLSGLIVTDLA